MNPVKFSVDCFAWLDIGKKPPIERLEILCHIIFGNYANTVWSRASSSQTRRELFFKICKILQYRDWKFEEVENLYVALGFPRPKPTKLKISVKHMINKLIKKLRRDMKY